MPALPVLPFVVKMLLNYAAPGVASLLNRVFFQGTQSSSSGPLNTAAQTIANSWSTNMGPQTIAPVVLQAVSLRDLSSSQSPTGIWTGSKPGTLATAPNAPQNAFVIRNEPVDSYRGGHSRVYLPGIPLANANANDSDTWTSAAASATASAWTTFIGNVVSALQTAGMGTVTACVPHYYKGTGQTWLHYGTAPHDHYKRQAIPVAQGQVLIDPYTIISWNPNLGTQRRRTHQSV
jgi:hypothetical protein